MQPRDVQTWQPSQASGAVQENVSGSQYEHAASSRAQTPTWGSQTPARQAPQLPPQGVRSSTGTHWPSRQVLHGSVLQSLPQAPQ
jgi:hypothetical protein